VVSLGIVGVSLVDVAVEVGIDERVLSPVCEDGVLLTDDAAHPMDRGEVGIGNVPDEHPYRPATHTRVGQERRINLTLVELEDAPIKGLNAAAKARDELERRKFGQLLLGEEGRGATL
jgi:hypothetical protein